MRSYLILSMCCLFLVQYFAGITWLGYVIVALAFLSFCASVANAGGFPRVIGLVMMGTGGAVEVSKGTGLEGISEGILLILPLLCLVTLAPLLSIPLKAGGYFESVDSLLKKLLHHPKQLFAGITSILFILSPILSLGSVRIVSEFLSELKLPARVSAKSYLVGFSTAVLWSPYFASVSLVLYYLGMPVGSYILYGIGLSCLSLFIGNILFMIWEKKHPLAEAAIPERPLEFKHRRQLLLLTIFVLLLLTASLLLEYVTKWSMIVIVSLISVFLPLLWGLVTNSWKNSFRSCAAFGINPYRR
ncbi:hypothetical protein M3212_06785 [Alkalihalobacillus oceani]|uniref:hypothetical protein n=1 Tax=Halalkalibacter oceani TaxID=1653776 RepID=UPI00204209CA|nr:hypothetical protein [Halalkalibacter oceani]MCM3760494.1 hypothetical protein [Halalkalibacter oceani]